MRLLTLVVLAACGSKPPPLTPLTNTPTPTGPTPTRSTHDVSGVVTDAATAEPLAGVTVVAAADGDSEVGDSKYVAIADEKGNYVIHDVPPGRYDMYFFYLDIKIRRSFEVPTLLVVDQQLDQSWGGSAAGEGRVCQGPTAGSCK